MRRVFPILVLVLLAGLVWLLRHPRPRAAAEAWRTPAQARPAPAIRDVEPALPDRATEPAGPLSATAPEQVTEPARTSVAQTEANYGIAFRYLDLSPEAMAQLLATETRFADLAGKTVRDPAQSSVEIAAQRTAIARDFLAALEEILTPRQMADYLSTVLNGADLRNQLIGRSAFDPAHAEAERVLRVDLYFSGYYQDQRLERWIVSQSEETKAGLAAVFMAGLADYRLLAIQQYLGMTGANPDGTASIYEIPLRQDPAHLRGPTEETHGAILRSLMSGRRIPAPPAGPAVIPALLESPLGPLLQQGLDREK